MEDTKITSALNGFQSDDLIEKLKLLNYEKTLLAEFKMKPLSRYYFVTSTNPGEQFYMFTLLAWWLFQKLGKYMDKPQESNDPHTTISNIMKLLEEMDVAIDFPSTKLLSGGGLHCLYILDILASQAIKVMKITCRKPHIVQEEDIINDCLDDNAEIILERIENEQIGYMSDDSNSEMDFNDNNVFVKRHHHHHPQYKKPFLHMMNEEMNDIKHQEEPLEILLDEYAWRLEFEEVLPQLKVYIKSDIRDWRAHLSQMETVQDQLNKTIENAEVELKKLHNEYTFNLEKLESREKHLNNELQQLIGQYKDVSIELSNIKHAYTATLDEIDVTSEQLKDVMAENNAKKSEMERRGQMMSDSSLVLQVKRAIAKLKEDIAFVSLEIALLVNSIDRDIMRKAELSFENERTI